MFTGESSPLRAAGRVRRLSRHRVQSHLVAVHRHPAQHLPLRLVHLRQLLGAVGLAAQLPADIVGAELVVRQDRLPAGTRTAVCLLRTDALHRPLHRLARHLPASLDHSNVVFPMPQLTL